MRIASLGSGSKGNATLIQHQNTLLMLDCGFSHKQVKLRMQKLAVTPDQITALLVTHEHSDHIAGVARLADYYDLPVYATQGTLRAAGLQHLHNLHPIVPGQQWAMGEIAIQAVAVPHDAREPCQFIFSQADSGRRLGILTDTGSITPHLLEQFQGLDAILLESNYDPLMLHQGAYPEMLKRRIGGDYGHLSNQQSLDFLQQIKHSGLKQIFLGHISDKNNCLSKIKALYADSVLDPLFVEQQAGMSWQAIA